MMQQHVACRQACALCCREEDHNEKVREWEREQAELQRIAEAEAAAARYALSTCLRLCRCQSSAASCRVKLVAHSAAKT